MVHISMLPTRMLPYKDSTLYLHSSCISNALGASMVIWGNIIIVEDHITILYQLITLALKCVGMCWQTCSEMQYWC